MEAIYKREVASYFKSLVAYVIIVAFGILNGLFFWNVNLVNLSVDYATTLSALISFLGFLIPIITMKLFSDEKKNGTEVLLRTAPVRTWQIVLGKYLASVTVFLVMVAETVICPIIISFLMNDGGVFPFMKTLGAYVGFILLGLSYLAIGTLASSLTESQPVAAVIGIVTIVAISFMETIGNQIGGFFGRALIWLALPTRFDKFAGGLFDIPSAFFLIAVTGLLLFVTTMIIERKRWN